MRVINNTTHDVTSDKITDSQNLQVYWDANVKKITILYLLAKKTPHKIGYSVGLHPMDLIYYVSRFYQGIHQLNQEN